MHYIFKVAYDLTHLFIDIQMTLYNNIIHTEFFSDVIDYDVIQKARVVGVRWDFLALEKKCRKPILCTRNSLCMEFSVNITKYFNLGIMDNVLDCF